ncbi:hypothetical protein V3C40_08610 [Janthinobacterium sp. LS2A]|uniref:hypothetical protein n=1 Tax=Janthinobacterium sp. LS2A TaxID=3118590 RepID=UPI002F93BECB
MFILKDGRAFFLEFLRNLTPQILLLSLAFLLGGKLDFAKFDFNNLTSTLAFFFFLLLFGLAAYVNISLYMEKFYPIKRFNRGVRLIGARSGVNKLNINLIYFRKNGLVFLEGMFVMLTIECTLAGVFVSAIATANKMST